MDLGLWEHQRSRRKTYRMIWSQGTETPEKTESYPGRICKAKSMEKGKGCSQADQVEFRNRRLLVHADVQERLTATLETDADRYVKIHSKASGQVLNIWMGTEVYIPVRIREEWRTPCTYFNQSEVKR